jgi:hypothetical protein
MVETDVLRVLIGLYSLSSSPSYWGDAMAIYIMGLAVLTNSTLPLRNASYVS